MEAVIEDRLFHGLTYTIRVWTLGAGKSVDKAIGAEGLIVSSYFVKLLPGVTHDLAGFTDIA